MTKPERRTGRALFVIDVMKNGRNGGVLRIRMQNGWRREARRVGVSDIEYATRIARRTAKRTGKPVRLYVGSICHLDTRDNRGWRD